MDLTQGTHEEKKTRAKKMMLWFGIASLIMSFAGITSAFIVSSSREDWLANFELPEAFTWSTVLIVISSISLFLAKRALKKGDRNLTSLLLLLTFALGLGFIFSQLAGFDQIIASGYYFTGESSNVTMSYIYLIAVLHILHVIAGLISLCVVIYNHFKQRYKAGKMLGFELASTFWHFVDILWLYLFFFLYFFR
ncbi:MAG: cytochrome c oxidase subunit 3 [Deltaproteobacteria bacterium]|nr:cytochrome c oxidase subunit 3 [Bacteroidia bacterium]MBT8352423.1 cytochrome c oxidase subunit 3 [Deltaproteobacteria bacterium]NNF81674.1 heme-copper oxidase subunit III [Flavobacteriaceae bacterium]MBT8270233.1 cytochrome c oxidase subunit 3 [Bacteroidia bacterium]NNK70478.1 heme-copper oxidase subunit III [Flavobacteriaceae bacterium]